MDHLEPSSILTSWEELEFKATIRELRSEEIDRNPAEISFEIEFLEEQQVRNDLQRYSPKALINAQEKISKMKEKAGFPKIEREKLGKEKCRPSSNSEIA